MCIEGEEIEHRDTEAQSFILCHVIRGPAISRCTLQEVFAGLRFLAARCRKLSQAYDSLLHVAGGFRRLAIPCCTLQEVFAGLRFLAARCRRFSQACDSLLHAAGSFRRLTIPCPRCREAFVGLQLLAHIGAAF